MGNPDNQQENQYVADCKGKVPDFVFCRYDRSKDVIKYAGKVEVRSDNDNQQIGNKKHERFFQVLFKVPEIKNLVNPPADTNRINLERNYF